MKIPINIRAEFSREFHAAHDAACEEGDITISHEVNHYNFIAKHLSFKVLEWVYENNTEGWVTAWKVAVNEEYNNRIADRILLEDQ